MLNGDFTHIQRKTTKASQTAVAKQKLGDSSIHIYICSSVDLNSLVLRIVLELMVMGAQENLVNLMNAGNGNDNSAPLFLVLLLGLSNIFLQN